jgi:hypothetical protein
MRFPPIPQDEREGLKALAGLNTDQIGALLSRLASTPLNVDRDRFSSSVGQIEGVDAEELQTAVSALLFLHAFNSGIEVSTTQFVNDVCDSLAATKVEPDVVRRLREVLPEFVELESLRLQAKAVDLQVDHGRTYQSAKIITELRPVFDMATAEHIVGALIAHVLKVTYFSSGQSQEIFIALDDSDLAELKKAIAKAEVKGRVLRESVVTKLGLSDFGTSPQEGAR